MSEAPASKTVIDCDSIIDIKVATDLYNYLKSAVENRHEVVINAAEVQRIDTAALQVFFAFVLEAQVKGMTVIWQDVSDGFRKAANLLGISSQLRLPDAV